MVSSRWNRHSELSVGGVRRRGKTGRDRVKMLLCLCHTAMTIAVMCMGELGGWVLGPGVGESTVIVQGGWSLWAVHCMAASWVVLEKSGQFKILGGLC